MTRDPFDEFRKMEKLFNKVMGGGGEILEGGSRSISVRRTPEGTRINVSGNVSEEEIERLKRKHPDADLFVNGKEVDETPVEVVNGESKDTKEKQDRGEVGQMIREVDEDEMDPGDLALKRFREKEKEKK